MVVSAGFQCLNPLRAHSNGCHSHASVGHVATTCAMHAATKSIPNPLDASPLYTSCRTGTKTKTGGRKDKKTEEEEEEEEEDTEEQRKTKNTQYEALLTLCFSLSPSSNVQSALLGSCPACARP